MSEFNEQNLFYNQQDEAKDAGYSVRFYIPNIITVLALCAGISAIKFGFESQYEKAILFVLVAAAFDGFDGRVARLLKAASPFGEQLDSLADAINFGVAPALILYSFMLNQIKSIGWIAALLYIIACCLRLARFNANLDNNSQLQNWEKAFFTGIPAPSGALLVMVPVYLGALGLAYSRASIWFCCIYTVLIGILLISRLPVWNGKEISFLFRKDLVIVFMLVIVAYAAFLVTYPWETLLLTAFSYAIFLPCSFIFYYKQKKRHSS